MSSERRMAAYNTQKKHLIIREYGRNTQNLINHAKGIEDREERQSYVEKVVELIMSMHPLTRNLEDYRLKIWSHVLMMANYELDVDIPDNLPDARFKRQPDKVQYPKNTRKLRHYGRNVRIMIEKAKRMEDPEQQQAYIVIIGSYMKMSYKTWNRENVNDEVIFQEFAKIANYELEIPEGTNIDSLVVPRKKKMGGNSDRSDSSRNTSKSSSSNSKSYSSKSSHTKKSSKTKSSKNRNSNSSKNSRNNKKR